MSLLNELREPKYKQSNYSGFPWFSWNFRFKYYNEAENLYPTIWMTICLNQNAKNIKGVEDWKIKTKIVEAGVSYLL